MGVPLRATGTFILLTTAAGTAVQGPPTVRRWLRAWVMVEKIPDGRRKAVMSVSRHNMASNYLITVSQPLTESPGCRYLHSRGDLVIPVTRRLGHDLYSFAVAASLVRERSALATIKISFVSVCLSFCHSARIVFRKRSHSGMVLMDRLDSL